LLSLLILIKRETLLSGIVKNDLTFVEAPDATAEAPASLTNLGILERALSSFAVTLQFIF
jgi:hypothetical protein